MKTLYLHIGMGKTGTTALQNFFWQNRGKLDELGVSYPDIGIVASAHHLLSPHHPKSLPEFSYLDVEQWVPNVLKCTNDKVLLSSELIAWADSEQVRDYCLHIMKSFNLKVVLYLRRQDNMIMASYNQQVKAGTQKRRLTDILHRQLKRFDYAEVIDNWASVVGRESIIIRPFESQQFYKGDLIKDFMHHVFSFQVDGRFYIEKTNKNPRLSFSALEFKRIINLILDNPVEARGYIDPLLQFSEKEDKDSVGIHSSKSLLSAKNRQLILNECSEVNFTIAREFLARDDGVLFKDSMPGLDDEAEDEFSLSHTKCEEIALFLQEYDEDLFNRLRDASHGCIPEKWFGEYSMSMVSMLRSILDKLYLVKKVTSSKLSGDLERQLILHIGMHKTATTSMQVTFSSSRDELKKSGIYFPHFHQANHSLNFAPLFASKPKITNIHEGESVFSNESIEEKIARLTKMWVSEIDVFMKSGCRYFLVSGEGLSMLDHGEVARLKSFVEPYFDKVKIIIYVREPLSFLRSAIQQQIKGGKKPNSNNLPRLYRGRLQNYIEHFGVGNVVVRSFEKESLCDGDVFTDFFHAVDCDVDVNKLSVKRTNESLGYNALSLISAYNTKYPYVLNGKPNSGRGLLLNRGLFFSIINRVPDVKFESPLPVGDKEIQWINDEISYVNQFLNTEDAFSKVDRCNSLNQQDLDAEQVPVEYVLNLMNEYNKEIERLNLLVEDLSKK